MPWTACKKVKMEKKCRGGTDKLREKKATRPLGRHSQNCKTDGQQLELVDHLHLCQHWELMMMEVAVKGMRRGRGQREMTMLVARES